MTTFLSKKKDNLIRARRAHISVFNKLSLIIIACQTDDDNKNFLFQNVHIHHPDNDIIGNEGLSRLEMDFPLAYFITAYTDARNFGADFSSSFSDVM